MSTAPDSLFGVTILPPVIGAAPEPPPELDAALGLLDVLQAEPRSLNDRLHTQVSALLRRAAATLADQRYRPRAHGLSASETERWAQQATLVLQSQAGQLLIGYARTCQEWERRLRAAIGSDAADPDWDMTSAKRVEPNAAEAFLAQTLEEAGIPVQAQVGVSRNGGERRGGWYAAYWLDCAHRDVAYLLRIDIELDGRHHYNQQRRQRDEQRNQAIQSRGWYVVRLGGRIIGQRNHLLALDQIVALTERHRRAIVLARSDLRTLERVLGPLAARTSTSRIVTAVREQAKTYATTPPTGTEERCPLCGNSLVPRVARKGPNAGNSFYGCMSFPRCRYTQPA